MQDSFRRSSIAMTLFGPLAVAATVATFQAGRSHVLTSAQLSLPDTGAGAGNTTAVVKVNGVAVVTLTLAGAAVGKTNSAAASKSGVAAPYPGGVAISKGDVITVDITGVPAGTAPKGGAVYLEVVQVDV